jgi:hypothetical protein
MILQFASAQNQLKISQNGTLSAGGTQWKTMHMDKKWRARSNFVVEQASEGHFEGVLKGSNDAFLFNFVSDFTKIADGYEMKTLATSPEGTPTNVLALSSGFSVKAFGGQAIIIDGKAIELPLEFSGDSDLGTYRAQRMVIPTKAGQLIFTGKLTVSIQDARKYNDSKFFVRLAYSPSKGDIRSSSFEATVRLEPNHFYRLPLGEVANRSFVDEKAGEGKGWLNLGPRLDLVEFAKNPKVDGDIPFKILRGGQEVIVLSEQPTTSNLTSETVQMTDTSAMRYLYLLHTSTTSRSDVGQIVVNYQDGSEQIIEVKGGRDVGNWRSPFKADNAAVAWRASTDEYNFALYASRFDLQDKPVANVTFKSAGQSAWMVLSATFSNAYVSLPRIEKFVIKPGKDWALLDTPITVQSGSVLDFSNWNPAPAGQFGQVIATPDGHFAFADKPDEVVRFFGPNLNFSANFLPKEEADALALRFRQLGYNAVRFHHYDVELTGGWGPSRYMIKADKFDQLDYMFHAMKEQGLYISIDMFTLRTIRNEEMAEINGSNVSVFKALVPISEEAMIEWKRFARDMLTHVNPYTGMTWAEDPALFSICPVNEDTIWAFINSNAKVRDMYFADFKVWLESNPRPTNGEVEANTAFNEYLAMKQMASDAEMMRFLKEELGVKALLTGNNWKTHYAQTPIRSEYDYVDNHGYLDHPSFPKGPWKFPYSIGQRNATANLAVMPRWMFTSRIQDKPFMITEFNYTYPNQYRGEGGPIMGTYAGLQGFDGLFRFAWAHGRGYVIGNTTAKGFDISQDPIGVLTEYMIGMLWLRKEVPEFEDEAVFTVNKELAFAARSGAGPAESAEDSVYTQGDVDVSVLGKTPPIFADNYSYLGLTKRISSRYEADADIEVLNQEFEEQRRQGSYEVTLPGTEVLLKSEGNFLVKTPKSKAIIFTTASLDESFVKNVTGGSATIFLGALDDQPLETSEHLVVFHVTNVLSEGLTFAEPSMFTLLDAGSDKRLVRRGSAQIIVPNSAEDVEVYAVALDGERIAEVPFVFDSEKNIVFTVETISENRAPAMVYEIVRAQP